MATIFAVHYPQHSANLSIQVRFAVFVPTGALTRNTHTPELKSHSFFIANNIR